MNNNKNVIKKLKDIIEELEKEELEECDVPSFADITWCELGDVLHKYKDGELDLKDYWKPGDTKITSNGCEYVILDIGYDKPIHGSSRTVTIMRRDLINLEVSFRSKDGSYARGFSETQLYQEFKRRPDYYVGWFFNNNELPYNLYVIKDGLECSVFLLSADEIFSEEEAYAYFKNNHDNRKLGNSYLTRTGGYYNGRLVDECVRFCDDNGKYNYDHPWNSHGLVPCFVI